MADGQSRQAPAASVEAARTRRSDSELTYRLRLFRAPYPGDPREAATATAAPCWGAPAGAHASSPRCEEVAHLALPGSSMRAARSHRRPAALGDKACSSPQGQKCLRHGDISHVGGTMLRRPGLVGRGPGCRWLPSCGARFDLRVQGNPSRERRLALPAPSLTRASIDGGGRSPCEIGPLSE